MKLYMATPVRASGAQAGPDGPGGDVVVFQCHRAGRTYHLPGDTRLFTWGTSYASDRRLAAALLRDALGGADLAEHLASDFADAFVATLPRNGPWVVSDSVVLAIAEGIEREQALGGGANAAA